MEVPEKGPSEVTASRVAKLRTITQRDRGAFMLKYMRQEPGRFPGQELEYLEGLQGGAERRFSPPSFFKVVSFSVSGSTQKMPGLRPARINEHGHIQTLNESCNMGQAKKQLGGRSA